MIPPPIRLRIETPSPVLMGPLDARPAAPDVRAWVPLPDGARATLHADGAVTLDARGRTVERLSVRAPDRCSLAPWGARAIVFCPDEGADPPSLGAVSSRLVALRGDRARWVPSRDGRTLSREGPCDPRDAADDVMTACSLEPDGRWREWRTDAPGALLDRHGALAIALRCARDAPCAVGLFDIDLARWRPLPLPDTAARWVRAGFDADGRVVGIVRTGAREAVGWFVSGAPGAVLRALRLPEPVDDAATDGPERAVFTRGSEAWATDDGGLSLRPVRGVAGVDAPAPRDAAARLGEDAACVGEVCALAGRFELRLDRRARGVP